MTLFPSAQLALDTIYQRPTTGIPSWMLNIMEHSCLERFAAAEPGSYRRDPVGVYLACQRAVGACMVDQWIPENPLTMGDRGFESTERSATTGAEEIVRDGIVIDSPEAVVEHLERVAFPQLVREVGEFDEAARVAQILAGEREVQDLFGPEILKVPYAVGSLPSLWYGHYGYVDYFSAVALYPEVLERHFSLQADLSVLYNRAAARAYVEGGLHPLLRLDHDMADSRGTLVRPEVLDRIWFPHFDRCLEPLRKAGIRLIWHCDGNLMDMVPRLLEVGLRGFQGFQYEDGMDYPAICRMKTRDGDPLLIIGGVSVTRTLPMSKPADVKRELDWLVEHGPPTGLFLAVSSSIAPGVSWENLTTLVEGLTHYREHGRP